MTEQDSTRVRHAIGVASRLIGILITLVLMIPAMLMILVGSFIWEPWWKNRTTREQRKAHIEEVGGLAVGFDVLAMMAGRKNPNEWYEQKEWYDDAQ